MTGGWQVRAVLCLAILMGGVAWTAVGTREAPRDSDRDAIRAHVDRIFKAYIARDPAEVRATHDKEWRGFITGTRRIIKGIDEYMREAEGPLKSRLPLVAYEMLEFEVQFRGDDLAIVPYVAQLEGEAEGTRAKWKLRVLDVYERQAGQWMQVASNTATHPDSIQEAQELNHSLLPSERHELLQAREEVWRAWFAGDERILSQLLPEETVALDSSPTGWANRDAIIGASRDFSKQGAKLVRLEYPRTDIQRYGETAILYTSYFFETKAGDKRRSQRGKAIEVFVRRGNRWLNSGWQLAPDAASLASN